MSWLAIEAIALASVAGAQPQPMQAFEVASIKPSRNGSAESNMNSTPGRLTATNMTVRELVRFAFGVKDWQIERAPGWIDSQRYDIVAKSAPVRKANLEDEQALLRQLLADRFQLATHREAKQRPVYLLVMARNGPKLMRHDDGSGAGTRKGCGHLAGNRLTMDILATVLSRHFELEVLNRTGLPGKYDFQLDWMPDSGPCASPAETQLSPGAAADPSGLPSIYTALEQQLGLELQSAKEPVEMLVVDRVERPSEN